VLDQTPDRTVLRSKSLFQLGQQQIQLATNSCADQRVCRPPILDCLRRFDDLKSVAKLRSVRDIRVVDLRHRTADRIGKHAQRIRRDARSNYVSLPSSSCLIWNSPQFAITENIETLIGSPLSTKLEIEQ
jgi:hypothetical protein